MKTYKTMLTAVLMLALVFCAGVVSAQQYTPATVTTGWTFLTKAGTSNAPTTAVITCTKYDEVAIAASVTGLANSTQTVAIVLAPSVDGTNYATQTGSRHTIQVTLAGAATKTTVTNLSVNGIGYLHVISAEYPDDAAAYCTNVVLKYVLKPKRTG
jgi:hypothetical protein